MKIESLRLVWACLTLALFGLMGPFSRAQSVDSSGPAAKNRSARALSLAIESGRLRAQLAEGFHFNLKAPNMIFTSDSKNLKPVETSSRQILFVFPDSAEAALSKGSAVLYVCDDANTFCDINRIALNTPGSTPGSTLGNTMGNTPEKTPEKTNAKETANLDKNKAKNEKQSVRERLERLQLEARKTGRLILIDFSARWCPGCRRLKAEILNGKEFAERSREFLKLEVDIDLFDSFDLSKRYDIYGVPTLMIVNGRGEEVSRLVDYQPIATVREFLVDAKSRPQSLVDLAEQLAHPTEASLGVLNESKRLLALRLLAANRFSEALPLLETIQPAPPQLLQARVGAALKKNEGSPTLEARHQLISALREAIKAEPWSLRSLLWRQQLLPLIDNKDDAAKAEREALLTEAQALHAKWSSNGAELKRACSPESVGEFFGRERFLAAVMWADFVSETAAASGITKDEIQKAWAQAAEEAHKSGITVRESGPALRYLIVLVEAGDFREADRWVRKLIKQEPQNKDLLRRRLRILVELKDFKTAVQVGEESLKYAEGKMEFATVELLARAYIGANRRSEAKALLDRSLGRSELQIDKMKSLKDKISSLRAGLDEQAPVVK